MQNPFKLAAHVPRCDAPKCFGVQAELLAYPLEGNLHVTRVKILHPDQRVVLENLALSADKVKQIGLVLAFSSQIPSNAIEHQLGKHCRGRVTFRDVELVNVNAIIIFVCAFAN